MNNNNNNNKGKKNDNNGNDNKSHSVTVSAPGKVILFGEHAVVQGKTAIATSLSLRTTVTFTSTESDEDDLLTLSLPDVDTNATWKWLLSELQTLLYGLEEINPLSPSPCNPELFANLQKYSSTPFVSDSSPSIQSHSKGVIAFLYLVLALLSKNEKKTTQGFSVIVRSTVPMGAGLGSSAAFCVSLVGGLTFINNIWKCGLCGKCQEKRLCNSQLELINQWSLQGEKILHGNPSGVDNSVATFGNALTFCKGKGFTILERIPPLKILITNTKVPRSTKTLVENVLQKTQDYPEIMIPTLDLINTISDRALHYFFKYFETEDVFKATSNLEKDLSVLIDLNHHLLTGGLGVGHSSLDTICQITKKHGLYSKLTGAGGGGCAFTLLKKDTSNEVVEELKKSFSALGFECWVADIGVSGVKIHSNL